MASADCSAYLSLLRNGPLAALAAVDGEADPEYRAMLCLRESSSQPLDVLAETQGMSSCHGDAAKILFEWTKRGGECGHHPLGPTDSSPPLAKLDIFGQRFTMRKDTADEYRRSTREPLSTRRVVRKPFAGDYLWGSAWSSRNGGVSLVCCLSHTCLLVVTSSRFGHEQVSKAVGHLMVDLLAPNGL